MGRERCERRLATAGDRWRRWRPLLLLVGNIFFLALGEDNEKKVILSFHFGKLLKKKKSVKNNEVDTLGVTVVSCLFGEKRILGTIRYIRSRQPAAPRQLQQLCDEDDFQKSAGLGRGETSNYQIRIG